MEKRQSLAVAREDELAVKRSEERHLEGGPSEEEATPVTLPEEKEPRATEKYGPDQIIRLLTGPMVQTVGRIRKGMAMCNRSLAGDKAFALEFKQKVVASSSNSK